MFPEKKIAIVHDYFGQYGGAEKVVEVWLEMFPEAVLYTSYFIPEKFKSSRAITKAWQEGRIKTTLIQFLFNIKFFQRFQKHLFWLYPILMSFVNVKNADIVLISSTYCGKNIKIKSQLIAPVDTILEHQSSSPKIINYCHSPTRFLHGLVTETDHKSLSSLLQLLIPFFTFWLKWMDLQAANYLTKKGCIWVGNSKFICGLIKQVYKVDSLLIYPPVEIDKFLGIVPNTSPNPLEGASSSQFVEEFYLCHGRVSFHKRIDLAILACLQLGKKLKIGGTSALPKEMDDLKKIVSDFEKEHPERKGLVQFLGRTTDEQFYQLLSETKGFLFPGKEDAGITPIEVFAAGVPVIAYQAGGALEYLQNGINGVFFPEQTVESLKTAILKYETLNFNPEIIKQTTGPFSRQVFEEKILEVVS